MVACRFKVCSSSSLVMRLEARAGVVTMEVGLLVCVTFCQSPGTSYFSQNKPKRQLYPIHGTNKQGQIPVRVVAMAGLMITTAKTRHG